MRAIGGLAALLAAATVAHADPVTPDVAAGGDSSDAPLGETVNVRPSFGSVVPATIIASGTSGTSLRDLIDLAAAGASPQQHGWTYAPSVSLTEEYDDGAANQYGGVGGAGSSFVTTLQPSITVSGDTERVHLNANYAPQALFYAGHIAGADSSQDRVTQNFDGSMLATLLPNTAFVDLRAFAGQQPRFGGFQPSTAGSLYSSSVTQNYSITAAPYVLHRFGGLGTVELGYSFSESRQDSDDLPASTAAGNQPLATALNEIANQNLVSQNLHFAATTGEDFGQYNASLLASATRLQGSGVLDHAYRNTATLEQDYAVSRSVALLTQIGYEDIHYSGTNPLSIHDVLWDVGVRYTPSTIASITLRYGHHDGFNSATILASVQPTARIQIYAQYTAGLSAGLEDLQNNVALSDVDANGNAVDRSNGTPLYVASDFSGTQSGLYRLKRFSAGATLSYDRDVFSLSVDRDDRTLLSSPTPLAALFGLSSSTRDLSGSASWLHQFTPVVETVASFQYGVIDGEPIFFGLPGNTDTFTASISATYTINPGLTLTALYSYSSNNQAFFGFRLPEAAENRVLIGLVKSF